MGRSTVWSKASSSASCCGHSGHVCRVKKSYCLGYLAIWSYFLCCTLLRSRLAWVTRRHLLQPSVRLVSAKAPPVHFKQANSMFGWPSCHQTDLFFPEPHIRFVMGRLCSPFRVSAPAW